MDDLTQLGRYQLVRVLGRGSMGVVYEGLDPKLNRQVAIKVIRKNRDEDASLKAEYSARFLREAQAVARLSHSNIVTVFDFGEENEVMYIVMEYIQGEELKHAFDRKHPFSLPDIVRMCCELLDAIDYAHAKNIIHRDIKPANVMLDYQGHVKLTDFGVARLTDTNYERTVVGMLVGTPSYMSPEQISGATVGPRSDIFAVGVILYQFLTGRKPFQAGGAYATQQKIILEDPELPSSINTKLGNAYDCVVFRALAKRAEDRYESARAFKEDLQRALAGEELQEGNTLPFRSKILPPQVSAQPVDEAETTAMRAQQEMIFWNSIKDSADGKEFALYLQRYPNGVYAELAKRKLERLQAGLQADASNPAGGLANHAADDDDEITQIQPREEMLQAAPAPTPAPTAVATPAPPKREQAPLATPTSTSAPKVSAEPVTRPPTPTRVTGEKPQVKANAKPSNAKATLLISATLGICVIGIVLTYFVLQPSNETPVHQNTEVSQPAPTAPPAPSTPAAPVPAPTVEAIPEPVDPVLLEAQADITREIYLLPKRAVWLNQAKLEDAKQAELARKKLQAEEMAAKQRLAAEAEAQRQAELEIARKAEAEAAEAKRKQDEINRKKAEEQRLKEEKELKRKKEIEEREAEYRRRMETR